MIACFGKNTDGQLGYASGEDFVLSPTIIPHNIIDGKKTCRIIASALNSFVIYDDGSLYSAGSSEIGRTGKRSVFSRIDSVEIFQIVDCCVGDGFFNLCTKENKLIGCGKNDLGCLGNGTREHREKPKLNTFFPEDVLQIQCGNCHVIALTKKGNVYSFGENRFGQLGDGLFQSVSSPTIPIAQLRHRPVTNISCGGEFSICKTVCGNVWSWGKNDFGQLGLGDLNTRLRPELVRSLKVIKAAKISCGYKHSIVISPTGICFGFGSNSYNELGFGQDTKFENYPTKIERLSDYICIDGTCGHSHTLVLTKRENNPNIVYSFGLNSSGQLGLGHQKVVNNIQQIIFNDDTLNPIGISSGCTAFHSFIFMEGVPIRRPMLPSVDLESIREAVNHVKNNTNKTAIVSLRETVAYAFSSISVLNASFRLKQSVTQFLIDLSSIREAYNLLFSIENEQVISTLGRALIQVSDQLKEVPYDQTEEDLSVFYIVLENPLLLRPASYHIAIERIINGILALPKLHRVYFFTQFKHFPSEYFSRVISVLQTYISFCMSEKGVGLDFVPAVLVLSSLHEANKEAGQIVVEKFFYNDSILKRKDFLIQEWYKFNMDKDQRVFNFWQYSFLIDVIVKNNVVHLEFDEIRHRQANKHLSKYNQLISTISKSELKKGVNIMNSIKVHLTEESLKPIINMEMVVRREYLLEDIQTILSDIVANDIDTLKLPLKCTFVEEFYANDQGGVAAEMLTLAIQAIIEKSKFLSPCTSTHVMWFTNSDSMAPNDSLDLSFHLGLLVGLAAFNRIFVNVPLPKYLYRIENSLSIEDLFYVDSSLANGLKQLLDFDFEAAEDLCITFTASANPLVEVETNEYVDLIPDGSNTFVNRTNRLQFVNLFIQHCLYGSCKKQVDNYLSGLRKLFFGNAISKCCTASEIENILIGQEDIGDLSELRFKTIYTGIYNDEHPIINWFWNTLSEMTLFDKHRFLHFVTGSNRVPCGGLKQLKLIIQPIPSSTAIPSAHTCFHILDLPLYSSKEQLKEKLYISLEYYKGFGIV